MGRCTMRRPMTLDISLSDEKTLEKTGAGIRIRRFEGRMRILPEVVE